MKHFINFPDATKETPTSAWDRKKHWGKDNLELARIRRNTWIGIVSCSFVFVFSILYLILSNMESIDTFGENLSASIIALPVWVWWLSTLVFIAGLMGYFIIKSARKSFKP